MPDFQLAAAPMPGIARAVEVSVSGDITSANVVRFQQEVTRALNPQIAVPVFLMRSAGFVSSAGFAYLVALSETFNRHGGLVIIVDPLPKIRLTMETLGIERRFSMAPDVPAARKLAQEHVERLQSVPRLVEVLRTQEGTEYPLIDTQLEIGSDPKSTIVLKHPQVDPHHAIVFRSGVQSFVKDLGTRFGTYVGKKKVTEAVLAPGDILTIATFRYAFAAAERPPPPEAEPVS